MLLGTWSSDTMTVFMLMMQLAQSSNPLYDNIYHY